MSAMQNGYATTNHWLYHIINVTHFFTSKPVKLKIGAFLGYCSVKTQNNPGYRQLL